MRGLHHGQEIALFFNAFGVKGILGIFLSSIVISFVIYKVFIISKNNNINSYEEFSEKIIKTKNKFIKNIINNIVNIFLIISFYIMVAGIIAFLNQEFGINNIIFNILIAVIIYIVFMNSIEGIVKINSLLIPILMLLVLVLGYKNIDNIFIIKENILIKNIMAKNWLLSALIYSSYNSITLIPILITLKKYIKKDKDIKIISILSGTIIIILAFIIYQLLNTIQISGSNLEIPIMFVAQQIGNIYKYLYGFVILAAIFTSAISSGYAVLQNVSKTKRQYKLFAILICAISITAGNFGFSSLVSLLYPIFGYLGIAQILSLILF